MASEGDNLSDSVASDTLELLNTSSDSVTDDSLEKLAYRISQSPPRVAQRCVRHAVTLITTTTSLAGLRLLGWLLLYEVVEPMQVLQAIIYTQNTEVLRICGTSQIADDVMEHLQFSKSRGLAPKFKVGYSGSRIIIDMLESSKRTGPFSRTLPMPYESPTDLPPKKEDCKEEEKYDQEAHKEDSTEATNHGSSLNSESASKTASEHLLENLSDNVSALNSTYSDSAGEVGNKQQEPKSPGVQQRKPRFDKQTYESQVRRILMSSMSPEEAVHRLMKVYIKNTEEIVAKLIVAICHESKMYNRFFGNLSTRLYRNNSRAFGSGIARAFVDFYKEECERLDVDPIRVSGQYFGHVLSTNALSWQVLLETASLDLEATTSSNRILLLAIFEEVKASMGVTAVEKKILGSDLVGFADGLLQPELATGFWDLAGFKELSKVAAAKAQLD